MCLCSADGSTHTENHKLYRKVKYSPRLNRSESNIRILVHSIFILVRVLMFMFWFIATGFCLNGFSG